MPLILLLLAALLSGASLATPVEAQDYPTKPVRLIIPYPPGGPTDFVGRLYAGKMSEMWGQPVVVENRSGANGNIASQLVAKSPGDGYTLFLHASSFVINPMLYKSPGYEPFKEFTPISLVYDYKLVVVVHPSVPVNSLAELVAAAKAKPGSLTYASAGGVGAPTHLSVEMFKQLAGIDVVHVPYQGAAPSTNDLLAGHINFMFHNPQQVIQHMKSGKLRGLATTGAKRTPQLPDLPTVAELGYPGFDVGTWFAMWGPAGMPAPIVEKVNAAVRKISSLSEVASQLGDQGLVVLGSSAAELDQFQRAEMERWGKVIREAKIEAQ